MFLGNELQEAFGADTYPACEQALEVILAQVDAFGNLSQGWLAKCILLKIIDNLLYASIIIGKLCVSDHAHHYKQSWEEFHPILAIFAPIPFFSFPEREGEIRHQK